MTLVLLTLSACRHVGTEPPVPEKGLPEAEGELTILHTNDIHGHYLPEPAQWIEGRPAIGGWARIDAEVGHLRATRPRKSVLLLDAGDQLTGTPLTDLVVDGSRGGAMHAFFETVGYDAWVVGNHEFDKGLDNLAAYTESFDIVTLSANLRAQDGVAPLLPKQQFSHVFERSGLKVGVIGATTDTLAGLMGRADFARLTLLNVESAVQDEVARLDPVTDLLIVVSHIGLEADERLARRVPGIDLIVGGHSHTPILEAARVEDTWIVQAGSYGRSLGVVDLHVEDDHIVNLRYELRDLGPGPAPAVPSAAITRLTEEYSSQLDVMFGEELTDAPALLGRDYHHESALGRWITDALRDATGAEVGMYNGGGLRSDILPGPVTRGTLFNCFPFGNQLQTFELRGADLREMVLKNAIAEHDERRGFLSLSGVTWTWRVRNGAAELLEVKVGVDPLERDRIYIVATNSFIAEQWERHLGVPPVNLRDAGQTDYEAAVTYAKKRGSLVDPGDIRAVKLQ